MDADDADYGGDDDEVCTYAYSSRTGQPESGLSCNNNHLREFGMPSRHSKDSW